MEDWSYFGHETNLPIVLFGDWFGGKVDLCERMWTWLCGFSVGKVENWGIIKVQGNNWKNK